MPHQCTNCGRVFADGSKEMLSGCPNCGGNKFQFSPSGSGSDAAASTTDSRPASSDATPSSGRAADADADTDTATTDRESANDDAGSTTWRRAASRAADAVDPRSGSRRSDSGDDDGGRPDAPGRDTQNRQTDSSNDLDDARRRGQSLREWANSRGFASEVEGADDETTLRENRRRTGDAQRRPPERRPEPESSPSPNASESSPSPNASESSPSPDSSESSPDSASTSDTSTASPDTAPTPSESSAPSEPSTTPSDTPPTPSDTPTDTSTDEPSVFGDEVEDDAQASARSDVVSPDEIRAASENADDRPSDADGRVIEPQSDDRPDLDELREELNDQFESIKIVAPGEYELNLMELYDRPEYIISLREDGRYVIEVPDTWDSHDDP
ncbi:Zn-ribbon containing protein [Halogeometricum sp. CBA1124]|uniref:OapC/ArvC family zinc-ribbon domain-containing protein n=1 Tax=Halogeometricum sp. CBA1124 TaxID=2668071 RepID=UPI00142AF365|nr:Zn-ribbon containing protein [Halogeometricum sp. CBA1124]MUV57404.1 hypothetical protein [Halogeometricum sp. CBA1124]